MNADDITISNLSSRTSLRLALVTETFPPEINGVAMTLGHLVDGLLTRGHHVQLVRPKQGSRDGPSHQPAFEETLATGIPIPRYDGLRFGLPAKSRLLKQWKSQRPDLIHVATEGPLGWSAVAVARQLKIPVSSGFHTHFDSYSGHYGVGWLKRPVANYLRKFHNRTVATLVPTRAIAQQLAQQGYQNLKLLARGVDQDKFSPRFRTTSLRQTWGLEEKDLAVLYVGRLAPEKNLSMVQAAFTAIKRVRPEARMVLVGDGPERHSLQLQNPEYIFAGMRTDFDLSAHYASGDLFLFPSLTETYGNVVLEAMASGLPVLAFDNAAASEVILDGVNGMLIPPDDNASFVSAACQLATREEVRQALGNAARQRAMQLDWEHIHDQLEATFLELVRHHRRALSRQNQFIQLLPV